MATSLAEVHDDWHPKLNDESRSWLRFAKGADVNVINTDGLVLIGPGSEWFWAAAQFVAVVVSLAAIYRQLRAQGAANFIQRMQTLETRWSSPRMAFTRLEVAMHLRYEHPDPACYLKAMPILDFFADLQNLEIEGYISIEEIAANWGRSLQEWAAFTSPLVVARRKSAGGLKIYDFEPLLIKLRAWDRKRGFVPLQADGESLRALLDEAIDGASATLRQEAAWQSGRIPEMPVRPATTPESGKD